MESIFITLNNDYRIEVLDWELLKGTLRFKTWKWKV